MSDLIRRQDAIDAVHKEFDEVCVWDESGQTTANEVENILYEIPPVEPERKKGQWSNYKDEHCCSVCKCVVISDCWNDEIRYDYCPYCGAEMSEGE